MKFKAGRGFTLEELEAAVIPYRLAPTIVIAVDHWWKNSSLEGLQVNVQRLETNKVDFWMRLSLASKAKLSNQTVGIIATELRPSPHYCSVVIDDPYFGGHYLVWICTEHSAFDLFNIDQQATWSFLCPNLLLSSNHIKIQCEDQPKYQAHPAITFTFVEPRIQHQAEDYKQKPL